MLTLPLAEMMRSIPVVLPRRVTEYEEGVHASVLRGNCHEYSFAEGFRYDLLALDILVSACVRMPGVRAIGIAHKDSPDWAIVINEWADSMPLLKFGLERHGSGCTTLRFKTGVSPIGRKDSMLHLFHFQERTADSFRGYRATAMGWIDKQLFSDFEKQSVDRNVIPCLSGQEDPLKPSSPTEGVTFFSFERSLDR